MDTLGNMRPSVSARRFQRGIDKNRTKRAKRRGRADARRAGSPALACGRSSV